MKNALRVLLVATVSLLAVIIIPTGHAQNIDRVLFKETPGWTITTYRAKDSKEFLRCSAERHYDNGTALTIARTVPRYTLAFTSTSWPFEDKSMHLVSAHVDASEILSVEGRVRLLNSGPIIFMSVESGDAIIPKLSKGKMLHVHAEQTSVDFDLTGSADVMMGLDECWRAGK